MLLNNEKLFDIFTNLFFHLNAWNLPIFKCAKIRYHPPPPMLLNLGMDCILLITIFNIPKIDFLTWDIHKSNIFWKILCIFRKNRKCYSIFQYLNNKNNCKLYSFMNKNVNVSENRQFLFQNSFNMKSMAIKIYFKNIFEAM